MVCRLCGAANPPQRVSCISCGSPLEHTPETRGARVSAEGRGARSIWHGLCLAIGGGLGLALVRLKGGASPTPQLYAAGILAGAGAAFLMGCAPGPMLRTLRRACAQSMAGLFEWLLVRRLTRLRRRCEETLRDSPGDRDVPCRLAAILWLQGLPEGAEQVLARAVAASESHPVARHNLAVTEAAAGRHARALDEFRSAASVSGQSARLYWNMGLSRWALGQYGDAAQAFLNVLELDPGHLPARNALALARARLGKIEEACSELEGLLASRRQDPDVLCNLGIIYQSRGSLDLGQQCFANAVRRDPTHGPSRYNRGICAMLAGQYHAAIADFSPLLQLRPGHAWALIQRALACYHLGRKERALDSMRQAIRYGPGDFQVRYNSGTLLLREEMIDRAVNELERAYEIDPNNIDVIVNLGVAMYLTGHLRHALDHFRAATRMNPRHALAKYNSVIASSMLERLDEAEEEVEELTRLYPHFADAFNAVGVVRLMQNRLVEAAEQFRRVADMMPRSSVARCNLALTYYLEGDLSAAREQAQLALQLDRELPAARDVAGHVALDMNEREAAIEHFRILVRLEPTNPDAHSNLGLAYYREDMLDQAIESYKRVLIFSPKSPEGHNELGLAYAKDRMLDQAARHLTQVIEWRPDSPVLHSNLGLVYYFKGDTENAVHEWREVTRLSPRYARMREATRFSAYDDQEMHVRPVDRRTRVAHLPLKTAAFRHNFQFALDEKGHTMEIPWADIAAAARLKERLALARNAARSP